MKHKLWCATVPRPMDQYRSNAEIRQLAALKCDCGAETDTPVPESPSTAHTPTPWRLERDTYGVRRIWDSKLDCDVASAEGDGSIPWEKRIANAEFIVRAVNSHHTLLEALKGLYGQVIQARDGFETYSNSPSMAESIAKAKSAIEEATRER